MQAMFQGSALHKMAVTGYDWSDMMGEEEVGLAL